jgi:hypothetical protein
MGFSLSGAMRTGLSVITLTLLVASAKADTITNIALSTYYNGNWATEINGSQIVTAPTNGNQSTGLTFSNWNGQYVEVAGGVSLTINNFAPITLNSTTVVNSLINSFFGAPGDETDLVFTNSLGQTASYSLLGNETVRDYNENVFTDGLSGSNTPPNGVTAQEWWLASNDDQRLDAQTIVLPSSWNGTNLTSLEISTPASGNDDTVLSALQVDEMVSAPPPPIAATPEPSSLIFLGTGALAVLGALRKRFVLG